MGNYMSSEPPKTPWSILHAEVIKLGEDFELELGGGGMSAIHFKRCLKNPGHRNMIPMDKFTIRQLPPAWRKNWVFERIHLSSQRVVKINVPYTSVHRLKNYALGKYAGKRIGSTGTGFANIDQNLLKQPPIDCPLKNCTEPHPHKVTPVFKVATAKHVVYDDSEAEQTTVEFFYDSASSNVVTAKAFKTESSTFEHDTCLLLCVSHDLELFQKVFSISRPPPIREQTQEHPPNPLVVIISHPHGHFKQVSFGDWIGYRKRPSEFDRLDSLKLSDVFAHLERESPDWETTGHSFGKDHMSPEFIREMRNRQSENPDMRFSQMCQRSHSGVAFPFMTYTAATCPGSSGSRVFAFYSKPDGTCHLGMTAGHFRCAREEKNKFVNASGWVSIDATCKDQARSYFRSLREE